VWARPWTLHLTLRFLGEVQESTATVLEAQLAATEARSFDLELATVGTFGGRRARVVWLRVGGDLGRLRELAGAVEAVCQAAGAEPERRPFRPHLTVARARGREAELPELPPLPATERWPATEFVLYESRLGRGGAVHTALRRYALTGG
jgi:2'-5' RNA ligase